MSLAFSAWSRRRSSGLLWSVAARSRIVLAGAVTGMPWWVVTSSERIVELRWTRSGNRVRRPAAVTTTTSIQAAALARSSRPRRRG